MNFTTLTHEFLIAGVHVGFHNRVFWIHTQDDQLFDLVCSYLQTEGFFDECISLYNDDWCIEMVN